MVKLRDDLEITADEVVLGDVVAIMGDARVAGHVRGDLVVVDIQANAFLHHMVRNIAGSLMTVGSGRRPPGWIAELMAGRDRTRAADTAPPHGLYLVEVLYPQRFGLPDTPPGPLLLGE